MTDWIDRGKEESHKLSKSELKAYHLALWQCGLRYERFLEGPQYKDWDLTRFVQEFLKGCEEGLPVPKLCRWLGYIQGVLIERGFTTVEDERNWTRPYFRGLDFGPDVALAQRTARTEVQNLKDSLLTLLTTMDEHGVDPYTQLKTIGLRLQNLS